MELSKNQLEVLYDELQRNGVLTKPCIECDGMEFNFSKVFKMWEFNPGGRPFEGQLLVVIPVICTKCGNVRFFNAKTIQDNLIDAVVNGEDLVEP